MLINEAARKCGITKKAVQYYVEQGLVDPKAPAAHDAFRSGIAPLELPQRFGGEKITVIAHGEFAFPKGVVVPLPMRASAVLLRPAAGMQDQPPGRVSVEQLQQGGPFLRAFISRSRLLR